jgi:hypothetical protein
VLSAGLDIRNASNGAPPHYRTLYLELRRRPRSGPMSREHARPQPPAGSRRRGGAEEPAPVPVGIAPATEPSSPGAKLEPPEHTQPPPAPPCRALGASGGQYRGPWLLGLYCRPGRPAV